MEQWRAYIESHREKVLWLLLTTLTIFAFSQRYPMDDAFISYRYAKFFADGQGLVWNIGERVEGYTNFLWTLILGLGAKLGIEPERFSITLSFPLFVAGMWLTWKIALQFTRSSLAGFLTLLIVGFNRSIYAFATSGLETTLQMTDFLAIFLLLAKSQNEGWTNRRTAFLSALLGVALLTRLDSGLALIVVGFAFIRSGSHKNRQLLSAALAPLILLVGPWLIWKLVYYGTILPNSFYIKVTGPAEIGYGLFYLHAFALAHLFHPYLAMLLFQWKEIGKLPGGALEASLLSMLWVGYAVAVGGDFMEFRFLVPMMPLMFVVTVALIWQFKVGMLRLALAVGLMAGTIHSNFALEEVIFGYGLESVKHLRSHLNGRSENWVMIGQKLKEYFAGSGVIISTGAAGAIPYYAELPAIDFLGLTDKEIARDHERFSRVPGHRIIARIDYLARRNANLIIEPNNHMMTRQEYAAWVQSAGWGEAYKFYLDPDKRVKGELLEYIDLIAIPIDEEHTLITWYLTPHPAIDKIIAERKWKVFRVERW